MFKLASYVLFFLVLLASCTPSFEVKKIEPPGVSDSLSSDAPGAPTLNPVIDITANSAVITWAPDLTSGGVVGSYELEYGIKSSLGGPTILTNLTPPYTLSELQPNTQYFVRIKAMNSISATSSVIRYFTTLALPPNAPLLLPVTAIQTNALINWNGGENATNFTISYGLTADLAGATMVSSIQKPFGLNNLTQNTQYFYKINASNIAGSVDSTVGTFTTLIDSPGAPVLGLPVTTQTSARILWTAGEGGLPASYNLKYSTSPLMTNSVSVSNVNSPYVLNGLTQGTVYYYQITAVNMTGISDSPIGFFSTAFDPPAAPILSSTQVTANSATLAWRAGAGGAPLSYNVSYGTSSSLAGATTLTNVTSPLVLSNLSSGTVYYYKVTAVNKAGVVDSVISSFTTSLLLPTAPVLAAVSAMTNSATLKWSAGAGGGSVSSYSVKYGTSASLVGAIVTSNVTSPLVVSNLLPSTTYYYQVTATNSAGSTSSAITSFMTMVLATGAPVMSPVSSITANSGTITWGPNATSGAPQSYTLRYSTAANFAGATSVASATSPAILTALLPATTYYVEVSANYASGSAVSTTTFSTLATAPSAPVLGAVTSTQTSSMISWSAGAGGGVVSSYSLSYGTNAALTGASVITNVTSSYNLTSLTANTLYYYRVTAINSTGSTSSTIASFTTSRTAPGAPSLGVVTFDMTTASVVWSAGTTGGTPSSYNFILSTNSALTGATPVIGASSPRNLTGLTANTTYYYQVIAINNGGLASSSIGSFTTKPLLPLAPVLGVITPLQTSAIISWSVGGAGGAVSSYKLTYGTSSTLTGAQTISNVTSAYSLSGLAPYTLYYVQITATNASGSTNSSIGSFTTLMQAPGAPVLGSVTSLTSTSASLQWTASASGGSASTFDLKWGTSSTLAGAATLTNVTTPKVLSPLVANTTYYYQIVATNSAGSTSSAIGNFTTTMSGPNAPVLGSITNIAQTSATVSWSAGPNISLNSFATTLHPVMMNRCSTCHSSAAFGTTAHGSNVASTSHDAMFFIDTLNRKKVNFTTPTVSRLYTKLIEGLGHACGTSCSGEVLTAINSWIAAGGGTGGIASAYRLEYSTSQAMTNVTQITNAASPQVIQGLTAGTTYYYRVVAINSASSTNSAPGSFQTSPATTGGPVVVDYGLEILMGDRRYVESVLRDVFGISSDSVAPGTTIRDNIFRKAEFGGACDVYAPVYLDGTNVEIVPETCFSGLTDHNKANTNASRQALVTKTCHTLVANSTAINNVFVKIFGSTTVGVVDDAKLALAYQLFYPDDVLSPDVKTALIALANTQASNTEKWRMIVLGLCVSPEWQTL